MTSLIAYRRVVTDVTTHSLRLPDNQGLEQTGQELATLADGRTVVCLFDGHALPLNQPDAIVGSIEVLPDPLPSDLLHEIKSASPQVRLINQRVAQAIAERYTLADEIKLLRTAPSPEMETYNAYAESCREVGRAAKAKLGLR